MYSNKIFEIFKAPKNAGGLQGSNGIGKYIDSECGDVVKMYLIIDEEISLQKEKLEKIKIQRKAMQQYLLTGIVRVS